MTIVVDPHIFLNENLSFIDNLAVCKQVIVCTSVCLDKPIDSAKLNNAQSQNFVVEMCRAP